MEVKCSYTEMADIDLLVPNPRNPNKHPEKQIQLLAKIMKHQGWRSPVIVSKRSGYITKGHGRLMAAKLNGWTQVPIDKQDYATEADEYADMVADNKIAELADTDMAMVNEDAARFDGLDLDLLGIPDFKIVDADILDPQCDEDEVPEAPVEPKTKLGDIYKLGNHRLMCGDSTSINAVEKLMNGEKANMVFTDPPYLQEANGGKFDGINKHKNLAAHDINDFDPRGMLGVLSTIDADSVYLHCNKALIADYIKYFEDSLRNWDLLALCKRNPIPFKGNKFLSDIEWIFFSRKPGAYFDDRQDYDWYRRAQWVSVRGSEFGHPTEKWIPLIEQYLKISSRKDATVLDLFGGSGSTLIACEKTNRKCFMMELDPKYCDVIVDRWEKYTGKKAELINGTT